MIDAAIRRFLPLGSLALVLAFIARGQFKPHAAADAWLHLRIGQEFIGGWSIRDPGHLGIYDTADWIPTQWLSQIAMARLESSGGMSAVMWLTGTICMALLVMLYLACRPVAGPLPAAAAATIALAAAWPVLSARPQLMSYVFVVLTLMGWLGTLRDGRPRWWIVVVAWIWPMVHGMWPVGLSISLATVLGLARDRRLSRSQLARVALVPALSVVVSVLNPLTTDTLRALVVVGSRSQYFEEWGPPDFTAPFALLFVAMLVMVIISTLRSRSSSWAETALLVLALGWGVYSMRTTPVGAILLAPFLAAALQSLLPYDVPRLGRERVVLLALLLCGTGAMAFVAHHRAATEVMPGWVDHRLDAVPSGARVLNEWSPGAYLAWRHPDLNLVMNGYGEVFTDSEIERNADISRLEPGWDRLVSELDVDLALVSPDSTLGYALIESDGWEPLHEEDGYALLEPRPESH